EQYGLLHPSVGDPATLCSLRGDAELTAIEKGKGFANGGLSFRLAQTASVFERLAHQGLELLLIHSQGVVRILRTNTTRSPLRSGEMLPRRLSLGVVRRAARRSWVRRPRTLRRRYAARAAR